jgi:cytochrome c biogenesis protein CcmG/thiol:disulfide interchange protein DsbE
MVEKETAVRGIVVVGVVVLLLVSGESGWVEEKLPGPLMPGQPAPAFSVPDPDGKTISLQDYQGRPVIINFWATWCGPCRQEMVVLQAVYEAHKAAGLAILAVSEDHQDRIEMVRAYWAALGLTFLLLLDPEGSVAVLYSVLFLPSTVFVHPSGAVVAVHFGPMTQTQMEQHLKAILPQPG